MNRRALAATAGATLILTISRVIELSVGDSALRLSAIAIAQFIGAGFFAAAVLVWLATRASANRRTTLLILFAIGSIIIAVNDIEAMVFRIGSVRTITSLAVIALAFHAVVVTFIGQVALRPSSDDQVAVRAWINRSPMFWIVRVVSLAALYGVIYFVAGAIIYPFVRDFYATTRLPDGRTVLALQLLVRGPAFVGVGVLVVLLVRGSRRLNAAAAALTLAGLGGVAALIAPNPLFPDHVRAVHLAEVGVSNAIFGWVVGRAVTAAMARRPDGRPELPDLPPTAPALDPP